MAPALAGPSRKRQPTASEAARQIRRRESTLANILGNGYVAPKSLVHRRPSAGGGTRTPTGRSPPGPKPGAYSNSATPAWLPEPGLTRDQCRVVAERFYDRSHGGWRGAGRAMNFGGRIGRNPESVTAKFVIVLLLAATAAIAALITIGGWSLLKGGGAMGTGLHHLRDPLRLLRLPGRALEPRRPAGRGGALDDPGDLLRGRRRKLVRPRQGRLRRSAPPLLADRPAGGDPRAAADRPHRRRLYGFSQEWHVEEERPIGSAEDYGAGAGPKAAPPARLSPAPRGALGDAGGGTRTHKPARAIDFESIAYANSATPARGRKIERARRRRRTRLRRAMPVHPREEPRA